LYEWKGLEWIFEGSCLKFIGFDVLEAGWIEDFLIWRFLSDIQGGLKQEDIVTSFN
jgi:hypothetical protein